MENATATSTQRPQTRVAIVGAGPFGMELAVAFKRNNIPFEIFDTGPIGKTISWWAPQTRWFSSNDRIAIAGVPLLTSDQAKATREQYLTYLRSIATQFGIHVRCYQAVIDIRRERSGFTVVAKTPGGPSELACQTIVLAVGGLDHARRLGIEGENLPHVTGYLGEPHCYFGRKVLIVGGRNSAVEAALRLHHAGADVSLSYRGKQLPEDDIKYWLYPEIRGLIRAGKITAYLGTRPIRITPSHVVLESGEPQERTTQTSVAAEEVLTLIGYEQDKTLFRKAGIDLVEHAQRPLVDEATLETNVPGIYVGGTAIAGTQNSRYRIFLENCHRHVDQILAHLTGGVAAPDNASFQRQIESAPES